MTIHDFDDLRLEPAVVVREWDDGNITRYPESHYLDFVVNGVSLLEVASVTNDASLITPLNRAWIDAVPGEIDYLLGTTPNPELASDRIMVLVCSVCGDLGCGAVTARMVIDAERVVWTDWRWETNYDEPSSFDGLPSEMVFDRPSYETVIHTVAERLGAFPYDELAHRGRRFLWPWQWGWRMPAQPPE